MLEHPGAIILDTETTGLGDKDQVIQVAAIDMAGNPLIDRLIMPTVPITDGARKVHGIHLKALENAPYFIGITAELQRVLHAAEVVIIYNADYDNRLITQTLKAHNEAPWTWLADISQCAMLQYAAYIGDWSDRFGSYKFQRLTGGDHTALGDCGATLDALVEMASDT